MTESDELFDWTDGQPSFRGLPVERHSITLKTPSQTGSVTFELVALKDAADLLDHDDFAERFLKEDMAPYGVEFWPASMMLAEYILQSQPGANRPAVELGCGLGLVSMAATLAGWRVTATDHDPTALRFARYNAEANNVNIAAYEVLDWHKPPTTHRYDTIFAADVLYQLTDHKPLLDCIHRLLTTHSPSKKVAPAPRGGRRIPKSSATEDPRVVDQQITTGTALIADPNRRIADHFPETARAYGFDIAAIHASATNTKGKTIQGRIFRLTPCRPK